MPRHPRRTENSNFLHVIVQGLEKRYIFENGRYKNKYYELMITNSEKCNVKILAYCIMDNHAHFLVHTKDIEKLSRCMKMVNTVFAKYYNEKEGRVGYVFRDRFVSESINTERQLYTCMVYIHLNPVKANIVNLPQRYYYSSYNDYIYQKNIVDKEVINLVFGTNENFKEIFEFIHYMMIEKLTFSDTEKFKYEIRKKNEKREIVKQKCKELKNKKVSTRKIAEMLGVSKTTVIRALKRRRIKRWSTLSPSPKWTILLKFV